MQVLAEETWSWMLFRDGADLYLSVLCGSVASYTIDLRLTHAESAEFSTHGNSYLAQLARTVSFRPDSYRERHIPGFERLPGISEATAAWRLARSAES